MLLNIQALRAFAALLVVFVHLKVLAARAGLDPALMDFGNAGVDAFFVISGVIMVFTAERRGTTAGEFLAHRIVRIVPFYWLMTLVVFGVALLAPSLVQSTHANLADLARSLGFIPYRKASGLMEPVLFVGWTLNYEMAFYLLFALTLLLRPRTLSFAVCGGVIVAFAAYGVLARPRDPALGFYSYGIILEFAAGMAIGWAAPRLKLAPWMAAAAGIAAGLSGLALVVGEDVAPRLDRVLNSGLPAMALVFSLLVLERMGHRLGWAWVQRLGEASYALYLTHFFVTQAVTRAAVAMNLTHPLALAALALVSLALAAAVGLWTHAYVEAPLTRWMKRRFLVARPAPIHAIDAVAR